MTRAWAIPALAVTAWTILCLAAVYLLWWNYAIALWAGGFLVAAIGLSSERWVRVAAAIALLAIAVYVLQPVGPRPFPL